MDRRQFLRAALAGGTAAALVPDRGHARAAPLQTTARIVIIGAGAAGTALHLQGVVVGQDAVATELETVVVR